MLRHVFAQSVVLGAALVALPTHADTAADVTAAMRATHGTDTFVLIDKPNARLKFIQNGAVVMDTPALLGQQRGDDERKTPKATPAGVFNTVVYQDAKILAKYGGTVLSFLCNKQQTFCYSIHETWTYSPGEKRPERLASPGIQDNFISNGCVNIVPDEFRALVAAALDHRAKMGRHPMVVITPDRAADLPRFIAQNFPGAPVPSLAAAP